MRLNTFNRPIDMFFNTKFSKCELQDLTALPLASSIWRSEDLYVSLSLLQPSVLSPRLKRRPAKGGLGQGFRWVGEGGRRSAITGPMGKGQSQGFIQTGQRSGVCTVWEEAFTADSLEPPLTIPLRLPSLDLSQLRS